MSRQLLIALIAVVIGSPLLADTPGWWTEPSTEILDAGQAGGDFSAVTIGQLKHVATQAKEYLDSVYPGTDWNAAYTGSGAPNPFPFLAGPNPENACVANIGQLKFIAYGFYKVLHSSGYPASASLAAAGCPPEKMSVLDGFTVPWGTAPVAENASVVNVGQLKLIFSFMPQAAPSAIETSIPVQPGSTVEFSAGGSPSLRWQYKADGGDWIEFSGTLDIDWEWSQLDVRAFHAAQVGYSQSAYLTLSGALAPDLDIWNSSSAN